MAPVTAEIEVDIKSPPDAYWNTVKNINFLYPKLFPHIYESIEILEGDGISAGTIRLVTYTVGSMLGRSYKSKIASLDEENRSVTYTVLEGDLLKFYKILDDTIAVREKNNGTVAYWSLTYEKATEDAPDGDMMASSVVGLYQKLDAYTLANMNKS